MDKLSLKILKFIAQKQDNVARDTITSLFGDSSGKSLSYLLNEGFIKSGRSLVGVNPDMKAIYLSNDIFSITSKGIDFLEKRPGKIYDIWSTRVLAIYGAITGTIAIVIELVLHFL